MIWYNYLPELLHSKIVYYAFTSERKQDNIVIAFFQLTSSQLENCISYSLRQFPGRFSSFEHMEWNVLCGIPNFGTDLIHKFGWKHN